MAKFPKATIKNVELVKVGTWNGAKGKANVTREHLADAVRAYSDPEIDRPVIKIGHFGGLALGDSAPAAGWVENPRLSADGNTLIGDLARMPRKLAEIVTDAYRRRSVEMSLGVTTPSGNKYAAALTGLALLGAQAPAVKGLSDVLDLYASEFADAETPEAADTVELSLEGDDTALVPHDRSENPEAKNVEPNPGADNEQRTKGSDVANIIEAAKKKFGLPDEATEDEVLAAIEAAELKSTEPAAPAGTEGTAPGQQNAEPAPGSAGATGAPAADAGTGTTLGEGDVVTVSAVQFSEMQSTLAELTKNAAEKRRADALSLALSAGKIAPAEKAKWENALVKNEAATIELLDGLQPRFSTIELGADTAPAASGDDDELLKLAEAQGI